MYCCLCKLLYPCVDLGPSVGYPRVGGGGVLTKCCDNVGA